MFSYRPYILVGPNDTGKTHFQRSLIGHLRGVHYERLPINVLNELSQPRHHAQPQPHRFRSNENSDHQLGH
jgi:hypothetical protein